MRITIKQVGKLMLKLSKDEPKLKRLLRYYLSFEENIDTYSKFCFPEYIQGDVPDFHKEFYDFLLDEDDGALASHRGSAKSTIAGLSFNSWNLVYKIEKYIVYVSQNHAKTVQFIEPIAMEFKINPNRPALRVDSDLDIWISAAKTLFLKIPARGRSNLCTGLGRKEQLCASDGRGSSFRHV